MRIEKAHGILLMQIQAYFYATSTVKARTKSSIVTEESRNRKGHIDLDKYEGHEYERMHIERWHLPDTPEEVMIANARLMDDAPLILLEVERLRKGIRDIIREMQEWTEDQVGKPLFRTFIDELKEVIE